MTRYFVSGTDTDAGKTCISSALLIQAQQQGLSAFGLKPIAAGYASADELTAAGFSSLPAEVNLDALLLQATSQPRYALSLHNPWCFQDPLSPHLAAQRHGVTLTLEQLTQACLHNLETADAAFNLIEGAGGWRVPFDAEQTLDRLAVALDLPVILVVGLRLGCLNHALLTAQAIAHSGCRLAGWVANQIDPHQQAAAENIDFLRQHFDRQAVPCLGVVPHLAALSPLERAYQAASYLQLPAG